MKTQMLMHKRKTEPLARKSLSVSLTDCKLRHADAYVLGVMGEGVVCGKEEKTASFESSGPSASDC